MYTACNRSVINKKVRKKARQRKKQDQQRESLMESRERERERERRNAKSLHTIVTKSRWKIFRFRGAFVVSLCDPLRLSRVVLFLYMYACMRVCMRVYACVYLFYLFCVRVCIACLRIEWDRVPLMYRFYLFIYFFYIFLDDYVPFLFTI